MYDTVAKLGKSIIQHGKHNDRVYLMKLASEDFPAIIGQLDHLAALKGYSKIFAKVPEFARDTFADNTYAAEAYVPAFYDGQEGAYFMGKYLSRERSSGGNEKRLEDIIALAKSVSGRKSATSLPNGYRYAMPGISDVVEMAGVYKHVFQTYPFPIHDPRYLASTMDTNTRYFGIYKGNEIVALSSAEMDRVSKNVEMTDFATLPGHRGHSFAALLLQRMEEEMRKQEMEVAYTIVRASSPGINITFARAGYAYSGTLTNNTNISGSLESMNVWHKRLTGARR